MFDLSAFGSIPDLIQTYGLLVVFIVVMVESMGVPVPGETVLVTASIYAGATHHLAIWEVVPVAAAGAIVGDNIGYVIGRTLGLKLLVRYGSRIGLTEGRLKIGQYLFLRHGGKIVFFGRFLALLRTFAALLAGANRMEWPHFLAMNAAGGCLWAVIFGGGAYLFGNRLEAVSGPISIGVLVAVGVGCVIGFFLIKRYERDLERHARQALADHEKGLDRMSAHHS